MNRYFSLSRWLGIVGKEFIQLRRDRLTFGMIVGIPIIQLVLFGFAINSDPKHLPTALLDFDRSEFSRSIEAALANRDRKSTRLNSSHWITSRMPSSA